MAARHHRDSFGELEIAVHVLLLSAYDALSQRYWRKGMVDALSDHMFAVHTLPHRYFSWRFRGNPLTWSGIDFNVDDAPLDIIVTTCHFNQ